MQPRGESDGERQDNRSATKALIDYLALAGTDQPRRSAGALLREFGTVGRVLSGSLSRLSRIVGPKVATLIRAANKLLQSSLLDDVRSGPVLSSRAELIRYLHFQLGSLRHERVLALYLDHNLRLLYVMRVADGSVASASPEISRIIHIALDVGASGILVVHNHPSGDPSPSISDLNWTARLSRVAADLNVRLIDHIIVAGGEVRSALEA